MPKIQYRAMKLGLEKLAMIEQVNLIVNEFAAQGFDMTLRQVYYQLVARDLFPNDRKWRWTGSKWVREASGTKNAEPNYKWLGDVINDGRMAGLIDWDRITDRTRSLRKLNHWTHPGAIIQDASRWYNIDLWYEQRVRPEVWIEKDALVGVFEQVCTNNDVPYFSCRGYTSQSEMWVAGRRLYHWISNGWKVVIFHFGDHDPSGIDMTRDIQDRLTMFMSHHWAEDNGYDPEDKSDAAYAKEEVGSLFEVRRMALTMDQVEEFSPPPNPAKQTDSRWQQYVEDTGLDESWELDALNPNTLVGLVEEGLASIRDADQWKKDSAREVAEREQLALAAGQWDALVKHLKKPKAKKD